MARIADLDAQGVRDLHSYNIGFEDASERIIAWIEENRSAIELEPGNNIYRDHFNSESLIAFIKGKEQSS
jgi:hypothetical protein